MVKIASETKIVDNREIGLEKHWPYSKGYDHTLKQKENLLLEIIWK